MNRGTFGNHEDVDTLYHIEPLERTGSEVGIRQQYSPVCNQHVNTLFRLNRPILYLSHQNCQLRGGMELVVGQESHV